MIYKLSTFAKVLGVEIPADKAGWGINILLTDSRDLVDPARSMFFAIRTNGNDGHRYIGDLYERGVKVFVVRDVPADMADCQDVVFIRVQDVVAALQKVAAYHRSRFDTPVVAITGSAGKTIVKEWLYQLLHHRYTIVRSPRSFNSRIGVPLSVWGLTPQTTLGIFEAGISKRGEMDALARIIRPTVGVLTCITDEHDEGFDSRRQKCVEKVRLLKECRKVVYRADDPLVRDVVERMCAPESLAGWSSVDKNAPLYISSVRREGASARVNYRCREGVGELCLPFTASVDIENAIHCLAVCLTLDVPRDYVDARMRMLAPVDTRLNVTEGVNDCMLVHDAYTTDYSSLGLALDFMNRRRTSGRSHTVILSDPQHEDTNDPDVYSSCASLLRNKGVMRVIGVGPGMMKFRHFYGIDARFFESTDELLQKMSPGDFNHEFILMKGAPRF
ncbi:MAG: bifunctional UDP-N-acetylmuramoyl-tripeptide:D-alanyl-D-alanine ligase/alanine racemase, partial [Muribaculaceae bacterium]|nr:bifunctional UDP-N-acetylmuramoyl-tripeptide:D-alanyl-D-alanine ligase/alanine racemase [Muribaculaceae bacterium]